MIFIQNRLQENEAAQNSVLKETRGQHIRGNQTRGGFGFRLLLFMSFLYQLVEDKMRQFVIKCQ